MMWHFTYAQELLSHPVTMALIRYKWRHLGCYVYFLGLFFYCLFVGSVTACVLMSPAPFNVPQIMELSPFNGNE